VTQRVSKALVVATIVWPLLLVTAAWPDGHGRLPAWSPIVYLAGAGVCHQRPERSFRTAGVQWPVCGRCSGLYLAAPLGAVAAASIVARRRRLPGRALTWLAVASVPTAVTFALEWLTAVPVSNIARAVAALPLGAAVAFVVVATAAEPGKSGKSIGYTQRP
jgi:uncharacterized membrane protein